MAKSADLIKAIEDARGLGWRVHHMPTGSLITSPASDVDHQTPEHIPDRWWPGSTYRKLFQLKVLIDQSGRVLYVAKRVSPAPWVRTTETRLTIAKAIDFLRADHG